MEIRLAQPEDCKDILALLAQIGQLHLQGRPDIFRSDALKYDTDALEAMLGDPDRPIFVAVENGKVYGYAFCIRKEVTNHPVLADAKELYIDDLCVDASARGKGVGTLLYQAAVALAKEMGLNRVTLNVWAFNESALAFYEKCGMKVQRMIMELPLEDTVC